MWAPRYWAVVYWTGSYWNPGGVAVAPAVVPDTHDGKGGRRPRRKPQVQLTPPPDFKPQRESIVAKRDELKRELLALLRPARELEIEAAPEQFAEALELAILGDLAPVVDLEALIRRLQGVERNLADFDRRQRLRRDDEAIMVLMMAA